MTGQLTDIPAILARWETERQGTFRCPTSVDVVDELPRNPTGKVLKKELRKPYWVGRDRQVV